jgi:hypothetical protein
VFTWQTDLICVKLARTFNITSSNNDLKEHIAIFSSEVLISSADHHLFYSNDYRECKGTR